MGKGIILAFLLALAASAAGQSSCQAANGLYLGTSGGRLGDPWFVGLYGTPGASGLLAVDVASGPVSTPLGSVCLGFTPSLQLHSFTLDGTGHWWAGGILPPNPASSGLTAFLQAAALDATQPAGFAVSNGASATLRPPRAFLIHPGNPPAIDGSFCRYDAVAESVSPAVTIPGFVVDAVMVPALNWLAVLTNDPALRCYDADTGASVLTQPLPWLGMAPSKLAVEGTTLYTMHRGWSLGASIPGGIRSFSLPSGAWGFSCVLTAGDPTDLMVLPGRGIAYLRVANNLIPVNLVTGTQLPTIVTGVVSGNAGAMNEITEWVLAGNVLYCMTPGIGPNHPFGLPMAPPVIVAIDTLSHTVLPPSPVPLGFHWPTRLRYGPGTNGNAVFVCSGANPPTLYQLDPVYLSTTGSTPIAGTLFNLALSPGGTEWLVLASYPSSLQSVNAQTLAVTMVTPYAGFNAFPSPIPNATMRRAFIVNELAQILPFGTDSATAPVGAVPLTVPFVSHVVVD